MTTVQSERNPRVKAIWERFLDYELGQFHEAARLFKEFEKRDPLEVVPEILPEPFAFESQRDFVRDVLRKEVDIRSLGTQFVDKSQESIATRIYRQRLHRDGIPSEAVALNYFWVPGGELIKRMSNVTPPSRNNNLKGAHS